MVFLPCSHNRSSSEKIGRQNSGLVWIHASPRIIESDETVLPSNLGDLSPSGSAPE
ncbi:membrane protein family-domain-containing protein [Mycobacterium phage MKC-IRE-02]